MSQSAKPVAQVPIAQVPAAQAAPAFAKRQADAAAAAVGVVGRRAGLAAVGGHPVAVGEARVAAAHDAGARGAGADARVGERALRPAHAAVGRVGVGVDAVARTVGGPRAARSRARPHGAHAPRHAGRAAGPAVASSVWRLVSQPLAGFMSQSAKPALQAPIAQAPIAQVAVALAKRQVAPQAPQLFASSPRTLVSQPSAAVPLQSKKPALQPPTMHAPATQPLTLAFGSAQAMPQPPQWLGSMRVSAQKGTPVPPSPSLTPGHMASDAPQVAAQRPIAHTRPAAGAAARAAVGAVGLQAHTAAAADGLTVGAAELTRPCAHTRPAAQALPQAPQWAGSSATDTQRPAQATCGAVQVTPVSAPRSVVASGVPGASSQPLNAARAKSAAAMESLNLYIGNSPFKTPRYAARGVTWGRECSRERIVHRCGVRPSETACARGRGRVAASKTSRRSTLRGCGVQPLWCAARHARDITGSRAACIAAGRSAPTARARAPTRPTRRSRPR